MRASDPGVGFVLLAGFKALAENEGYLKGMRIIPCEDGKTLLMTIAVADGCGPPVLIETELPPDTSLDDMRRQEWFGQLVDDAPLEAMEPEGHG